MSEIPQHTASQPLSLMGHMRAVLVLGLPLVGGNLAQFSIGLTDSLMMGWYSVEGLAAVTLASTFFFVVFIFGGGFGQAVMPLVAAQAEAGEDAQIRRTTRMGLWMSFVFALAALPLFWWSAPILLSLGQGEQVAQNAQVYLRIAGWGIIPALGVMVLKSYLAALERTQVVLWVTLLGAAANALVNYALIFGNFGFPELGIRGSAIASLMVQILSLVVILAYSLKTLPQHQLLVRIWRPDWEAFWTVARLGVPIGFTLLAEVGLFAASSIMMGWFGTMPLAAHGAVLQISSGSFMIYLGLASAATVRAGQALSRHDVTGLKRGAWAVILLSAGFAFVTITAFLLIPELLVGSFVDPSEPNRAQIIAIGASLLVVAAVFQLVDGAQVLALGLLRGLQDTQRPMVFAAISYWLIGVPISYVLGVIMGLGGVGIWAGLAVGLAVAAWLMMWRFWKLGPLIVARR